MLVRVAGETVRRIICKIEKHLERFCKKGMTITIDAMGTQTNIARSIKEKGADYVLALKGNQQTLLEVASLYLDHEVVPQEKETLREKGMYEKTVEKGHGRIETRECYITSEIKWLNKKENWSSLRGSGVVISTRGEIGKEISTSHNYFIYSLKDATASDLLRIKREHWTIENNLHWVLYVSFREDDARARQENAAENLNILRKQALQMMKQETSIKGSMKSQRLRCSDDIF
jgi:predicted transposase YbfD/YdcC